MDKPAWTILVVDDETNLRRTLKVCLEAEGARVIEARTTQEALAIAGREPLDMAFVDLRLGEESGLELIPKLLARQVALGVVMITAYATFETAVEAVKRGARDYLPKPFTPAQVRHALATFAATRRTLSRVNELEDRLRESVPEADLETRSASLRAAHELAFKAAATDTTVLIRGETGTGKTVLARAIHARSPRAEGPFVTVSGAALTAELLASDLFGHAKGAFTGAVRDQIGKVEAARRGTLFLDEIGEVELSLQAKLLRLLQEREYERVGETETRQADVRFIAATNRDLEALVREKRFREDLLFRLNVIEVHVPPLRERREDLALMAESFAAFFSRKRARPLTLSPAFVERLTAHTWPGNVRELKNALERAAILASGDVLEADLLPEAIRGASGAGPVVGDAVTLAAIEDAHMERVIARASSLEEAARILGVDRATLWRWRKKKSGDA